MTILPNKAHNELQKLVIVSQHNTERLNHERNQNNLSKTPNLQEEPSETYKRQI